MPQLRIDLWDLVSPLAKAFDMMSPALAVHSLRVAYLAHRLAGAMDLPLEEQRNLAVAGALHDIGAFSLSDRLDLLAFEETRPAQHSAAGYLLLKDFKPLSAAASLIEFHHHPWMHGKGAARDGKPVPAGSHILHLADRVAVSFSRDLGILAQLPAVCAKIVARKGDVFIPEGVDALLRLAGREYVWLEIESGEIEAVLGRSLGAHTAELDDDALLEFARLLCRIIDFKSPFTATHSSGVAAVGSVLARLVGFSRRERRMFEVAAYLHDLGKLAVPSEILEKPGKLTSSEWDIMRTHVYYTYKILSPIEAVSLVTSWGALHQERLDGSGYPFRYSEDDIPLGARIIAVADVFTGITEDRPYRKGMAKDAALDVVSGMVSRRELDGSVVGLLVANYDAIDRARILAQAEAARGYEAFRAALETCG